MSLFHTVSSLLVLFHSQVVLFSTSQSPCLVICCHEHELDGILMRVLVRKGIGWCTLFVGVNLLEGSLEVLGDSLLCSYNGSTCIRVVPKNRIKVNGELTVAKRMRSSV